MRIYYLGMNFYQNKLHELSNGNVYVKREKIGRLKKLYIRNVRVIKNKKRIQTGIVKKYPQNRNNNIRVRCKNKYKPNQDFENTVYTPSLDNLQINNFIKISKQDNKEIWDKLLVLGLRELNNKQIFKSILKEKPSKINLNKKPGVSIITSTNRPTYMKIVLENFLMQKYENKELIIILNNNKMDKNTWKNESEKYENIKVFQLDENKTLGECLNYAVDMSSYDYISKFDDDNYYGPEFIGDLMNAFIYTDARIVGKYTYYTYFEGNNRLILRCQGNENRYVNFVSGSALIIKKDVFNKIKFPHISCGEDSEFLSRCVLSGIKIYSSDRFNYACIRHPTLEEHTWRVDERDLAYGSKDYGYVEDFKEIITI